MTDGSDKADRAAPTGGLLAAVRIAVAALGTLACAVCWLAGGAVLRGRRRERLRAWAMRGFGRVGLWALGVRVEVVGDPPATPGLVVSNHVSYVDILVYAATLGASFVSMVEIRRWPLLGPLARLAGTVFIDRGRKRELVDVNERIRGVLAEGRQLVVFPEGSNSDGADVQPFRPSLLQPAASGALPVHYAAVSYRSGPGDPPASTHVAWYGGRPFLAHALRMTSGRPVRATVRFGPVPLRSPDRKQLADDLRGAVRALFTPLDPPVHAGVS